MADTASSPKITADPAKLKTLKIKTGVVRRYTKEKQSYEKEAALQRTKIEKFKAEGKDEHFMRQQEGCLKESETMVPEIQRQLLKSYEELKGILEDQQAELEGTEEYKAALEVIEDAKAHLPEEA